MTAVDRETKKTEPFIVFSAVDSPTGLEITVSRDGFGHDMELLFADARL